MRIHFICSGNAFRSRIAEAYFNSLGLPIKAVSSGTVAEVHAPVNGPISYYAQAALERHHIDSFGKPSWTQLSPSEVDKDDLLVFMNRIPHAQAAGLIDIPANSIIWDIPDIDDITGIITADELTAFAEKTYNLIKTKTDELAKTLLNKD